MSVGMQDSAGSSMGPGGFRVVTVSSNKGGVGKTTIATNLAIHFRVHRPDVPVLLLSLDDQSLVDRLRHHILMDLLNELSRAISEIVPSRSRRINALPKKLALLASISLLVPARRAGNPE